MTAAATTAPLRPAPWRNAVLAIFATNGLGISAIISRAPTLRDELHISVAQLGMLILAVSAGSIVGLLLSGHVVDALGGRRTIALTLSACGVAVAGVGLGASLGASLGAYGIAWAALAVYGIGTAICDVAMNVEGGGAERATGKAIMPWFHAAWSMGTVLSAGVASAAAFAGIPPLAHLAVIGAVVIAGGLIGSRFLPRADPTLGAEVGAPSFRERMSVWLEPRTLLIGLIMLGMAFAEGSANDWLAVGFHDDRGLDAGQAALVFGAFTAAMTVGRIIGVPLLDRFGRVAVLRAAAVAALVGMVVVILVPSPAIGTVGVVIWGLGASLGFPVGISAAGDDPAKAVARVSTVSTIGYGAFLIGPPVLGFVGQHVGVLDSLWIVFGLVAVATLAIPAARPPTRSAERLE